MITLQAYKNGGAVDAIIESKSGKLSRKINSLLRSRAKELAARAAQIYADKLRKDASTDALVQSIIDELSVSELSVDMTDAITPELIRAFADAGILGVGQVGIGLDDELTSHLDRAAMDYAETRSATLIRDLAGTTIEDLRSVIARGVEEGMSSQELSDAIQEAGTFGEARGDMIARTELANAHIQGNMEGWKQTGEVDRKQWLTAPGCCDLCAELDGVIVGMDEDFPNDGGDGPPLHPNCRCDILPVRSDNEGED